ncbi:MAG TPA: NAD(P)H-dependent oxidoreductase [Vicinamibacterales bacterium]|nr:NAD(P)H-dependent oxidoreductase [Vicinamibacterales bacterium]
MGSGTATGAGDPLRVLAFAGSLRARSYNGALLRSAQELAPEGMVIDIYESIELPLFNEDVESHGDPGPVAAFKAAIRDADAILIATPEYNYGVPGVLKNAIDWASRPPGQTPLNGKLAGIIGASPGVIGTARAQQQLRQAFAFTNTPAMLQPEVLVGRAHEKFDRNGRLSDEATRTFLRQYLETFHAWATRLLHGALIPR